MQNSGLTGLRFDLRDRFFSHSKLFGAPDPSQLPKQGLGRRPLFGIKNQGFTSFCPWFSTSAGREYQEQVELSPEAQALLGSKIATYSIIGGADARDALRTLTKYGSVENAKAPPSIFNYSPEQLANPANFSPTLEAEGKKHIAQAFFTVDGEFDAFDNIRNALALGQAENQVIYVAGRWYSSWNNNGQRAVIRDCTGNTSLHMYIFIDWTDVDGEDVLVLQNSYGTATGDQGLQYLSREAVNASFAYNNIFERLFGPRLGAFIVRDMPQEVKEEIKSTTYYAVMDAIMKLVQAFSTSTPAVVVPSPAPAPVSLPPTTPVIETNQQKLYRVAYSLLSPVQDASPLDEAPDELGCVDSVWQIVLKATGLRLTTPKTLSTAVLLASIKKDPRFKRMSLGLGEAQPGDLIICATGQGDTKIMPHGHVGIVGKTHIMSNNSSNGMWEANYTKDAWYRYFAIKGKYPIEVFRILG